MIFLAYQELLDYEVDSDEEWEEEEPGESLSHSEGVSDTTSLLLYFCTDRLAITEAIQITNENSHQKWAVVTNYLV